MLVRKRDDDRYFGLDEIDQLKREAAKDDASRSEEIRRSMFWENTHSGEGRLNLVEEVRSERR